MELKNKVKTVRKRLFITQEQLGAELGCTRQTVNRWEDGTMSPSFILEAKFEKFCEDKKIKFEGDKA